VSTLHSKDLPDFISAESPQGLRRKMFKVNAKYGAGHQFFDFSIFTDKKGKQRFICWYYRDLKNLEDLDGDKL